MSKPPTPISPAMVYDDWVDWPIGNVPTRTEIVRLDRQFEKED